MRPTDWTVSVARRTENGLTMPSSTLGGKNRMTAATSGPVRSFQPPVTMALQSGWAA